MQEWNRGEGEDNDIAIHGNGGKLGFHSYRHLRVQVMYKSIFLKVSFIDHFYYSHLECPLKCRILSFAKTTKMRISAGQVLEIHTVKFEKHYCIGC